MKPEITVILTGYNRPNNLKIQLQSIKNQTIKPVDIILWYNKGEFHQEPLPGVKNIICDYNFSYFGRFGIATNVQTEYTAIFDDDTIPGREWFENCIKTIEKYNGILGSTGDKIIDDSDKNNLSIQKYGWWFPSEETIEVDYVGHCWFFRTEWIKYMWMERPLTFDNGEDIHFSYCAKKYGNIKSYCPPHPPNKPSLWGSLDGLKLGSDEVASWKVKTDFHKTRSSIVTHYMNNGLELVQKNINKNFNESIKFFEEKLKNKECFAFSKYADGELYILKNQPINILWKFNGEFCHSPDHPAFSFYQKELVKSFKYKHDSYYVGIGCPCCIGVESFNWMKEFSEQNEDHLTWANVWVNSNYKYYLENIVPLYSNYEVIIICNKKTTLNNLPFKIKKDFRVGTNCWMNDYSLIQELKNYITNNNIKNHLFLFCAGPFGNLLAYELHKYNKENTYLDIGSTLDPILFENGKGITRGYHTEDNEYTKLTCTWS